MAKYIESAQNRLVKRLHGLKLRKNREKEQVFVAEGIRFVGEIPKDWPVECYVVSASYAAEHDITELEKRAEVYVLTDTYLQTQQKRKIPRALWQFAAEKNMTLQRCWKRKTPFSLWQKK